MGPQFALKPAEVRTLSNETLRWVWHSESDNAHHLADVRCHACGCKLGIVTLARQDSGDLSVFNGGKVGFVFPSGEPFPNSGKLRWAQAAGHPAFRCIHQSHDYGTAKPSSRRLPSMKLLPTVTPTSPECPPAERSTCMDWRVDCLDSRAGFVPRPEQIEAFRLCMLHNHIVVLPTGFGKTLIASMVMAKMEKLNRESGRLALIVVDRLPLVEQQKRAIENHTGLTAATMSSETNTTLNKQYIFGGGPQALVATAGALLNHLLNDERCVHHRFDLSRVPGYTLRAVRHSCEAGSAGSSVQTAGLAHAWL